jgi:hypothetical protein
MDAVNNPTTTENTATAAVAQGAGAGAKGQGPRKKRGGGVKTERGKQSSRCNSLKHSLCSKVVFSPDLAAAIIERTEILTEQFKPRNAYERMLIADMGIAKAKYDFANVLLVEDHFRCLDRAYFHWDADHEERAIDVSKHLERDCEKTVHTLARTKKGAELLVSYWEGLAEAAETNGDWDDAQRQLAFNLLGVRPDLRSGSRRLPPSGDRAGMAALAAREIKMLRHRIANGLGDQYRADQGVAISGFFLDEDAQTRNLRRLANGFRNDFTRWHGMLLSARAEAPATATPTTGPGLFPPVPPVQTAAGFDFLYQRCQAISTRQRRPSTVYQEEAAATHDEDHDDTEAQAQPAGGQPEAKVVPQAPRQRPEPRPTATPDPAAEAPPRRLCRRARKELERRQREKEKAARRAARRAAAADRQ